MAPCYGILARQIWLQWRRGPFRSLLAGDMQGPLCGSIYLLTWPLQRGPRIFSPLRGRTLPRGGGAGSGAAGSCAAASQTSPRAPS